jgi:hypothetical protein
MKNAHNYTRLNRWIYESPTQAGQEKKIIFLNFGFHRKIRKTILRHYVRGGSFAKTNLRHLMMAV